MKKKPALIIAITLVIGFFLGFLTSGIIRNQQLKRFRSFSSAEGFKYRTLRMVEPTEEQMKDLLPVLDKFAKKSQDVRKEYAKEFRNLLKEYHSELKPLLMDEQIKKMESFSKRRPSYKGRRDSRSRPGRHQERDHFRDRR